jgi:heme/copper-type cytochrome/quinol oxidase subunit 2
MDTLSHGLWAAAAGKGLNLSSQKRIKLRWMAIWGIFPDIFAFAPVIIWMLWQLLYHGVDFSDVPRPETMPPEMRNSIFVFRFINTLYNISHSFIVFLGVFFLVWLVWMYKNRSKENNDKRPHDQKIQAVTRSSPPWEMAGWFIHIALDIPTHTTAFYPTLLLWPFSDWHVNGFSWGNIPFIIANYISLFSIFIFFKLNKRGSLKQEGLP